MTYQFVWNDKLQEWEEHDLSFNLGKTDQSGELTKLPPPEAGKTEEDKPEAKP